MQQAQQRLSSFRELFPHSLEELPLIYSWLAQMREQHPVFKAEHQEVWQVFRYEDVKTVIIDYQRFSSELPIKDGSFMQDMLVRKDPPEHRILRNLVNQAFTPRAVALLSDRVRHLAQELLDKVRMQGSMDIVADLAFPLPARVIAEMLGVPEEDWDIFQRWARAESGEDQEPLQETLPRIERHSDEMTRYFSQLLEARRREPREDLITSLSLAEVDGKCLSEQDLVSFCVLLLGAGQGTTKNLITNAMLLLTDQPLVTEQVRQHPDLISTAIEEVLRYLPPVWCFSRYTTAEVELRGQYIPAHQTVLVWTASANRDPAQFPDPDRFDVQRVPNRHLTFGHGIHFCVGAPLARLEATIVLPMMLEQLKEVKRVEGVPIPMRANAALALSHLPVTFQPA
jgi:cytochrome P450 family 109